MKSTNMYQILIIFIFWSDAWDYHPHTVIKAKYWNVFQNYFLTHRHFFICCNILAACLCSQDLTLLYCSLERSKTYVFTCLKCTPTIILVWTDFSEKTQLWYRNNYSKILTNPEHMWSSGKQYSLCEKYLQRSVQIFQLMFNSSAQNQSNL